MRKVIAVFTAMILALSVWSVPTLSFAEENMIQNVGISSQQGRVKLIKADGAGDVTFTEEEGQNGSIMLEFDGSKWTANSARTAHPFQRNGAPFRFKLSKAQQVN